MKTTLLLTLTLVMASACSSTMSLPKPTAEIGTAANKDTLLGVSLNNGLEITAPFVKLGVTAPSAEVQAAKPQTKKEKK